MIHLRDYQQHAVDACYRYLQAHDGNPAIVCPTGAGKSHILAQICSDAVNLWNGRVLILAHVKELLEQNAEKVRGYLGSGLVGLYSAGLGQRDMHQPVIAASIQSIYRRALQFNPFDLIIIDECHLIPESGDGMYRTFLQEAKIISPHVRLIGLTATPFRMTTGLICSPENLLNEVCYEIGVRELIIQGYLCPLKSKAGKKKADMSGLHLRGGEFIASEIEELMDQYALVSSACSEIVEQTTSRNSVLIFASGVGHARHIKERLEQLTHQEVGMVTGDTPASERAELLARFKGKSVQTDMFGGSKAPIKYLVNVNVLTTGFDAPNVDCVVLLRPTNSLGLYYQMVGRGFRLHPAKQDCLVLDFGGNILRHGPVDALQIKDGACGSGQAPAKECPECQAVIHAAYGVCPECGFEFPPPERQKHESQASTAGVLSGEVEDTEYAVSDTIYSLHTKKNAGPDDPPTMRVQYHVALGQWISEWICFEHTGYARAKAVAWWTSHSNEPVPDTVQQAVELAHAGALAETEEITVRSISGQKFDRVIGYKLGPKPPLLDGSEEKEDDILPQYSWAEDDIPF